MSLSSGKDASVMLTTLVLMARYFGQNVYLPRDKKTGQSECWIRRRVHTLDPEAVTQSFDGWLVRF